MRPAWLLALVACGGAAGAAADRHSDSAAAATARAAAPAPAVVSSAATPADTASSSAWLARLPAGETKRRFILDCTGCHQFDERRATVAGRLRTETEWSAAIRSMLAFAGPTTAFPVISSAADPERTAAWLAAELARPAADAEVAAVPLSRAEVREFLFPAPQDLPHDVAIDGRRIVVTGMFSHAMHLLDPATEQWTQVEIPVPQANPRAVEIDANGDWWVVLGGPRKLARYDGTDWQTFDVGEYAHSVALDSSGGAYANGHFSRDPEVIIGVSPVGTTRRYALPAHPTMAATPGGPIPYELRTAPDGSVWMSELQGNRIVRLDPENGEARAWTLPTPFSGPRRFDIGPDGVVWIPAYAAGLLVRFDPATGEFEELPLPVADALPYVARIDARRGRVWVGTAAADEVLAYRPSERRWERYALPSRGALVRHLAVDARSGDLWLAYGESPGKLTARIARLRAP